jgi:hypothetical protein
MGGRSAAINGARFGSKEKQRGGQMGEPWWWRGGGTISLREASRAVRASAGRLSRLATAVGGRRPRRPTWAGVAEWAEGLGQNH